MSELRSTTDPGTVVPRPSDVMISVRPSAQLEAAEAFLSAHISRLDVLRFDRERLESILTAVVDAQRENEELQIQNDDLRTTVEHLEQQVAELEPVGEETLRRPLWPALRRFLGSPSTIIGGVLGTLLFVVAVLVDHAWAQTMTVSAGSVMWLFIFMSALRRDDPSTANLAHRVAEVAAEVSAGRWSRASDHRDSKNPGTGEGA